MEIGPLAIENRNFVKLEEEDIQKLNRAEAVKFEENPGFAAAAAAVETGYGPGEWDEYWATILKIQPFRQELNRTNRKYKYKYFSQSARSSYQQGGHLKMSKERDSQLLKTLKEICENTYFRPTDLDLNLLENVTLLTVHDISHSLNNLQRDGAIRIHMGLSGEPSKVELLKSTT